MNQRKIWWCDVAERDLWRWGFTTGTFFIKEQAWASFTRSENHLRKLKDFNILLNITQVTFFLNIYWCIDTIFECFAVKWRRTIIMIIILSAIRSFLCFGPSLHSPYSVALCFLCAWTLPVIFVCPAIWDRFQFNIRYSNIIHWHYVIIYVRLSWRK